MFFRYKTSLALALLLAAVALQARAYQLPVEIFEYADDVKIVAFIDKKDIDESQNWRAFESAPPLSVNDALAAVKRHINARQPEIGGATLETIELRQIPQHPGHWHYMVKLKNGDPKHPYHYFVVLMNGKVVPAVHEIAAVK